MGMTEKPKKPQLHSSHLSTLYKCGYKFQRVVLSGEREPPTTPLVIGTASHSVVAHNLQNKIDKGTLLTREAVQDFARDEFIREWQKTPVIFDDEEKDMGLNKTRDLAQDATIAVVTEHHYRVAPKLRPVKVEQPWVLEAVGYPYDLAGTIDIKEKYDFDFEKKVFLPKEVTTFRDLKTRKRDMGQREVDSSEQYTIYFMAMTYTDGAMPDFVYQDTLIKPTKTMPARAITYRTTRTKDDIDVFHRRFEQACKIIEKEAFTPANPADWWCSKEHCGFAAAGTCPYFNSKRGASIKVPDAPKKPQSTVDSLKGILNEGNKV
jgi:PD-(D/E)XK nuclease superfamily